MLITKLAREKTSLLAIAAALGPIALIGPSYAQSNNDGAGPAIRDEIVVTTQRREQSQQDVPITVNTLGGDDLKEQSINYTVDLAQKVPGLVLTPVASFAFPYLRGVGTDQQTVGLEPSVATHIDGVYFPRVASAMTELYDISRIEVIKGPQGTLFGRNATGGVVHVITQKPEDDFGAYVDFTAGNHGRIRVESAINIPLAEDVAAFRLSGVYHDDNGYSKNVFLDIDEDDTHIYALRGQLAVNPSDNFEIRFFGDYAKDESGRGGASHPTDPLAQNVALGVPGGDISTDIRTNFRDIDQTSDIEEWGAGAEINIDLGWANAKSLTSFRELEHRVNVDFDLTALNFGGFSDALEKSENWMQEFQLTSSADSSLDWLLGVFLFGEDVRQDYYFPFASSVFAANPAGPAVVPGGLYDAGTSDTTMVDTFSWAIFGQTTIPLTDKLSTTLGARYSKDRRDVDYNLFLLNIPTPLTGPELIANRPGLGASLIADSPSDDYSAFTPRAGLEYDVNDDVMLFFSASRGFKAGGFNGILFGAGTELESVQPETLWSYEGGVKSTLFDRRARVNATFFYYDYKDIQLNILTDDQAMTRGFANVRNAGDATIKGAELEFEFAASENLRFDGLVAYLDTELDTLIATDPNDATSTDQTGNPLPNAPEFSLTVGASYSAPIGNVGEATLRADFTHKSRRFHSVFEDQFNSSDPNDLLNARLTFDHESGRWSIAAYVRNLLDKDNESFGFRAPFFGSLQLYSEPRNYGINIVARL